MRFAGRAMKYWSSAIAMVVVATIGAGSQAQGAEARPWLCRDKPVFSSDKSMSYEATKRDGGRWLMTFMRFDPSGLGHDGFTVFSSHDVSAHSQGTLEPGQWYAVALYRLGGHWICPGNARKSDAPAGGSVSDLCFGEEPGDCTVKLTVRPQ